MKKLIHTTCALLGTMVVAGAASAAPHNLAGSDTLDELTTSLIAACPAASGLTYIGGGSSNGEQAMLSLKQETAPMSRVLASSRTCRSANPRNAECHTVALDGIAITGGAENKANANCGGIGVSGQTVTVHPGGVLTNNGAADCAGTTCPGNVYTFNSVFDALRIIYGGEDHAGGSNIANKNCASDLRKSLINQWGSIFTAGCTSGTCTTLSHAFRRGDFSGTTDTFLGLLGLPGLPSVPQPTQTLVQPNPLPESPFCNGWERDDKDPVKHVCGSGAAAADQVCEIQAGVLLPIVVPENLAVADAYPTAPCASGKFALKPGRRTLLAGGTTAFECPEANYNIAGQCYAPQDAAGNFNCVNSRANHGPAGTDGLAINRFVRSATGVLRLDGSNIPVGNAFYRTRSACSLATATENIGCLTSNVACSIGYAGREAAEAPIGTCTAGNCPALTVGGVLPTTANIQALVQNPPPVAIYPIARRLNECSLKGFNSVTDTDELGLAACYTNVALRDPLVDAAGFVRLPAGGSTCTDFDETSCTAENAAADLTCGTNADCGVFPCVAGKCDFTCATDTDCSSKQPGATCIAGKCGFAAGSNVDACPANP